MTSCVRILSTQELDSFPSILLVAPNGKKILVNCGEGCQRIFLEFGQKVSTIDTVCLTHLGHEAIGGLPGMILTASDVVKMATDHAKQIAGLAAEKPPKNQKQMNKKDKKEHRISKDSPSLPIQPGLKIIGPNGTSEFFRSLRHFMRRDSFLIDIREGACSQLSCQSVDHGNDKNKKRGPEKQSNADSFLIQSFSAYTKTETVSNDDTALENAVSPSRKRPRTTNGEDSCSSTLLNTPVILQHDQLPNFRSREILSFLFTTPPIQGRFLVEKAKALGVPRGPLYGQLKAGKSVSFSKASKHYDGDTITVTVESHQVVEPGSPGVVVAVLCYPSIDILEQIKNSKEVKQFHNQNKANYKSRCDDPGDNQEKNRLDDKPTLEVMVHITTRPIFESDQCITWRRSFFNIHVRHMFVRSELTMMKNDSKLVKQSLSAFQSAHSGAQLRSKISHEVFRATLPEAFKIENNEINTTNQEQRTLADQESQNDTLPCVVHALPLLEYVLLPRAKRGFSNHDLFLKKWKTMEEEAQVLLNSSGCIDRAKQILENNVIDNNGNDGSSEILFTGTGSAIPCKHRNVSGIYVRMDNGNAMLLDVGEGTVGQLLRAKQNQEYSGEKTIGDVLRKIKAVWISHPHADHHLGLLRLLEERKRLVDDHDPLVLIGPANILAFLQEYESVVPWVADSYIFLDCRILKGNISGNNNATFSANNFALKLLQKDLGIHRCTTIPVAHCANSFAVVFRGTSFGSIAYSGDCRPSRNFAQIAYNADVLIHEATFADGMEADAVVKRHCTVGEALKVAQDMNAKTIILTHFSQRYPKIPVIRNTNNMKISKSSGGDTNHSTSPLSSMKVIHAFDFMTITPSNMCAASQLTPALEMLYPDNPEDTENEESLGKSDARAALEVPGLFAQSELL